MDLSTKKKEESENEQSQANRLLMMVNGGMFGDTN
jgi:hypothetical protein